MKKSIMQEKSYSFAIQSINLYKELILKKEYVLSKQLLRSATSVGANIRESRNAQTKKDFIHKLSISQKECDESIYWSGLLQETNYIDMETYQEMSNSGNEILKMLKSSIITARNNLNRFS
ncbi:MAG: four helix bundle protein [Fluviicola sp.]|nr:four helix bundle protein [Fluviicola sp.]